MMKNTNKEATLNNQKIEAFAGQVVSDLSAGMSGVLVQIGHELGLYKAMQELGHTTAEKLAEKTNTFSRYVQEWLNNQAAGGYVIYHPEDKTYFLPPEHALILADEESPAFMTPGFNVVSSLWFDKDKIITDFTEAKGVGWHSHHHNLFFGTEAFFRAGYRANLVSNWLPSLEGVEKILTQGGKVADVGCGHGASTIIMAQHYPNSLFYGFDYHEESIRVARERAKESGLKNVVFEVAAAENFGHGPFNLICFMDALHDFGDPLYALRYAKRKLANHGTIMLVEPAASDDLEKNFNPVGRMFYAASTTLCVPHSHSQNGGYCLGAQAGPSQVKAIASQAGFRHFRIAHETPVNHIYEIKKWSKELN